MYEYKTIIQDVVPDLDEQQKLDDDLNLICQKGNWEVFHVDVKHFFLYGEFVMQKIYTLRRSDGDRYLPLKRAVAKVMSDERWGMEIKQDEVYQVYKEASLLFPLKVTGV